MIRKITSEGNYQIVMLGLQGEGYIDKHGMLQTKVDERGNSNYVLGVTTATPGTPGVPDDQLVLHTPEDVYAAFTDIQVALGEIRARYTSEELAAMHQDYVSRPTPPTSQPVESGYSYLTD